MCPLRILLLFILITNLLLRVCFLPQFLVTAGNFGKKKSHKDFISNALFWSNATHARNCRMWRKQCLIRSQETQILLPAPLICFAILGTHFPSQVLSFSMCTMEISSPRLCRVYYENARLEETQAGIKIAGRNINNLRYAGDTTLMEESEDEKKASWWKWKRRVKKLA